MEIQTAVSQPFAQVVPVPEVVGQSFGRRFWAYLIDLVALNVVNAMFGFFAGLVAVIVLVLFAGGSAQSPRPMGAWDRIISIGLTLTYFTAYEWLYGATLGKVSLHMRVVQPNGEPCRLTSALVRGLFRFVDGLFFGLVAYLSMQNFPYQRVGDKAANTVVADAKDPAIQHRRSGWSFLAASVVYALIAVTSWFVYALAMFNPS